MARKKVKLAYITKDSKRRATFKKRKNGLIKKVDEISTLCGIEACAVIFGENDPQPEVWPSPQGVQNVLSRFKRLPDLEQTKKMFNHESFLKQRIEKAQENLNKQKIDNKRKEMTHLMFQCLDAGQIFESVNMNDLNDLSWLIDQNLKHLERRINETPVNEVVENRIENFNGMEQGMVNNVDVDFNNNQGDILQFQNDNYLPQGF
ncbi:agamous-like MADS-box protein AGL80 [Vicia villosa]|uniref:agamous-like MADS-box protein AGL80 n=1 Tax=Vicia villosa TaxID=3911 RepID=UPI00273B2696|nr:agamous-like MADS-box protein AGL80 [Vicia villosa]